MISQNHKPAQITMLPLKKVAEYLDVSLSTVRRLINEGGIRSHRVGGQLRVSLADLQSYVAASIQGPSASAQT